MWKEIIFLHHETDPMRVLVYASEIAAAVGKNRYKQPWEVFESMWVRLNPEQYREYCDAALTADQHALQELTASVHAIAHHASSNMLATPAADLTTGAVQQAAATTEKAVQQAVQRSIETVWASTPDFKKPRTLQEVAQREQELDKQGAADGAKSTEKSQLQKTKVLLQAETQLKALAKSEVQCTFGTVKEDASRAQLEVEEQQVVHKDNRFHTLTLGEPLIVSHRLWGIGGRVDGVDEQRRVVEIKNRTRAFFTRLPEYELVQVQAYMALLDAPEAVLVQQLNGRQKKTVVARDGDMWTHEVVPALQQFMDTLDTFLDDDSHALRLQWVQSDATGKASLLEGWLADTLLLE